jgi:hypothetical protein
MVQRLLADIVGRVDHNSLAQGIAVLSEKLRHRAAGQREQHDVCACDRRTVRGGSGDRDPKATS